MMRAKLFAIVFIITALLTSYWMYQRIPHDVIIHINDRWHLMLVHEQDRQNLKFDSHDFQIVKQNTANLWLSGHGSLYWNDQQLEIFSSRIRYNQHEISSSRPDSDITLFLYRDGTVMKGQMKLR